MGIRWLRDTELAPDRLLSECPINRLNPEIAMSAGLRG